MPPQTTSRSYGLWPTVYVPPCYKHNIFESSVYLLSASGVNVQVVVALFCIIVFSNAIISVYYGLRQMSRYTAITIIHITYKQIDLYASLWNKVCLAFALLCTVTRALDLATCAKIESQLRIVYTSHVTEAYIYATAFGCCGCKTSTLTSRTGLGQPY